MSVAEKQNIIDKLRQTISNKYTVSQVDDILEAVQNVLSDYSIVPSTNVEINYQDDLLNTFLTAKTIEGCSEKTIKQYKYCVNKMIKYLNVPINSINVYHIRDYFAYEKNRGISDQTIKGYKNIYSSLFTWLHKESLIKSNPCVNIGSIKCEKKIRLPFSDIDLEKLKECCDNNRNKAIIFFLLSTGCRISEMCELNKDDINLDTLECIVHGKGNKQRTVFLSNVAAMMLKRYLNERTDNYPALFIGKGSSRLQPGGVRYMLKKIAIKAGVENVHPHRCRRTLATSLINHGMQIQDVAFILGHEKLDTTMKYVYISKNNVKDAYKKYT